MKITGVILFAFSLALSTLAIAGSGEQSPFEKLKSLAGTWQGPVVTDPPEPSVQGKVAQVTLRVTSMGNALLHEMKIPGRPDDPITMLYVDDNRLLLTHYCDAGNRPRMVGTMPPGGNTVEFQLLDVAGPMQFGHMHKSAFSIVDPDHHTEDWTFMVDTKAVRAHFDLQRVK